MGIGAAWFGRSRRFVSGGSGGTLDSIGVCGGNSVLGIEGYWTRLAEMFSDSESPYARITPVLLGLD